MYEGSMKGSGVDSVEITLNLTCECGFDGEADYATNDWQTMAYGECPECGKESQQTLGDEADDLFADQPDNGFDDDDFDE